MLREDSLIARTVFLPVVLPVTAIVFTFLSSSRLLAAKAAQTNGSVRCCAICYLVILSTECTVNIVSFTYSQTFEKVFFAERQLFVDAAGTPGMSSCVRCRRNRACLSWLLCGR
jgi:hypothetical protein